MKDNRLHTRQQVDDYNRRRNAEKSSFPITGLIIFVIVATVLIFLFQGEAEAVSLLGL